MKVLLILPMLAILLARPVATATTPAMRNSGPAPLEMKFKLKGFPSGLFWKQLANKMENKIEVHKIILLHIVEFLLLGRPLI